MEHRRHSWTGRPWLSLFVVAMLAAGCSSTGPEDQEILVVNETEGVIYFLAFELEASHLVDPIQSFEYIPGEIPVLQPGASMNLQLDDIGGDFRVGQDLRLFIYRITDDRAELSTLLTVPAEELRSSNFRIEISES
jgi:hypothetical protein